MLWLASMGQNTLDFRRGELSTILTSINPSVAHLVITFEITAIGWLQALPSVHELGCVLADVFLLAPASKARHQPAWVPSHSPVAAINYHLRL